MSKTIATRTLTTNPVDLEVPSELGFSLAELRKPLDIDTVRDATRQVRDAATAVAKAGSGIMYDSSLLLSNVADVSKLIGPDGVAPNQGAYAAALGYSEAWASKAIRLGRAIRVHGIRRNSPQWTHLASLSSMAAFKDTLGKPDGGDKAAFKQALAASMSGKTLPPAGRPGGATAQTDSEADAANSASDPGRVVVQTVGDAQDLLRKFEVFLHTLSDADAVKVHSTMERIVRSDRDRRLALIEKAKANGVTPLDVPPKRVQPVK